MKTGLSSRLVLGVVAWGCVGSATAQTAYLDFGKNGPTGTVNGVTYNDIEADPAVGAVVAEVGLIVNGAASTTGPAPLLATDNTPTGWGFELDSINSAGTVDDNGSKWFGPYPAVLSGIETTALESMFYFNRNKDLQATFSGLDDNQTYNILVYGGHDQVGTTTNSIVTGIPITGSGADYVSKTMNTWTNTTEVIQWSDVAPAGGVISFELDGGSRESWLNFMWIERVGGNLPGDTDGDGDIDDADLGTSFANYTGPGATGKTAADGDTDGDGDVDDGDLGTSFAGYTGPLAPGVPEPAGVVLLGLGGLALACRRRRA